MFKPPKALFSNFVAQHWGIKHPNPNQGDFLVTDRSGKKTRFKCGHRDNKIFGLQAYGRPIGYFNRNNLPDECGECVLHKLKKFIIRCCICGGPILPSQTIILYRGKIERKEGIKVTTVSEEGGAKIGCCACNQMATHAATHTWNGEKAVRILRSGNSAQAEAARTGKATQLTLVRGPELPN